jgi:hypothetical protein
MRVYRIPSRDFLLLCGQYVLLTKGTSHSNQATKTMTEASGRYTDVKCTVRATGRQGSHLHRSLTALKGGHTLRGYTTRIPERANSSGKTVCVWPKFDEVTRGESNLSLRDFALTPIKKFGLLSGNLVVCGFGQISRVIIRDRLFLLIEFNQCQFSFRAIMSDRMSCSRELLLYFIKIYKSCSCLWKFI